MRMFARRPNHRHMRVVIRDLSTLLLEEVHQVVRWRFAVIIHVRFVCETQQEHATAIDGLAFGVERLADTINDVLRHGGIDFASEFNETSVLTILTRLPSQVKRINRNAVTAQTRAGIKWHETKRLGLCSIYDFPNVNTHGRVNDLEFVDERDVHTAKN